MFKIIKKLFEENHREFQIKNPIPAPTLSKDANISQKLDSNKKVISELLHYPASNDVQIRDLNISLGKNVLNAFLVFYDGLVDNEIINNYILKTLMKKKTSDLLKTQTNMSSSLKLSPTSKNKKLRIMHKKSNSTFENIIKNSLLPDYSVTAESTFSAIIEKILHGDTALFVDGEKSCYICDTKKIPGRSVTKAEIEMNLKGPSEGFVENFRTNTALIRKFIKDENLVFESVKIGTMSKTTCAISYISTIANDSLIDEVKRRLTSIDIDYLLDSGELEQLIEDKTFLIDPLVLSTEKPDKVASHIIEGRIAIIVEGSNNVLIVPAIFTDFTHASEDSYIRFPYAMLLRIFRVPAIFLSIFLPGIYISICNFHQEMIPTDLLFAIAGAREKVPFTMLTELLIMEVAFEIIREASIRTPSPMGATIGIVGTLILGQAIVSANIVSPILVIIVAFTGISTFVTTNYALNYSFRIMRFIYIILRCNVWFFWTFSWNIYSFMFINISNIFRSSISYTICTD